MLPNLTKPAALCRTHTNTAAKLLVVEDSPSDRLLLAGILQQHGYSVRSVAGGAEALEVVQLYRPDLILLDIALPDINGYDLCQRFKTIQALQAPPVIFISALEGVINKVRAFGVGGVDYISKPVEGPEVLARVRTHLLQRSQARRLEEALHAMEEMERLRDNLVSMMVHDLRTPLAAMRMTLEMLALDPLLAPGTARLINEVQRATEKIHEMVSQILDISRLEAGRMPLELAEHSLEELLDTSVKAVARLAGKRPISVSLEGLLSVRCDAALIDRVVTNLLANAIKFSPASAEIAIAAASERDGVRIAVTDRGPGIPRDQLAQVFDKFGQAAIGHRLYGAGLGLTFCKLAVEAHGGCIGVESEPGCGSTFWFTLPVAPLADQAVLSSAAASPA